MQQKEKLYCINHLKQGLRKRGCGLVLVWNSGSHEEMKFMFHNLLNRIFILKSLQRAKRYIDSIILKNKQFFNTFFLIYNILQGWDKGNDFKIK